MYWWIWLAALLPLFVVLYSNHKRKKRIMAAIAKKKKEKEKDTNMIELLKTLIGKRCTIHDSSVERYSNALPARKP